MDLDQMIAVAAPARRIPQDAADSAEAGRLYQAIVTGRPTSPPRARRRRRAVWVMASTAIAGAAAGTLLVAGLGAAPGSPPLVTGLTSPATVALLDRIALTAARTPVMVMPGHGKYLYIKVIDESRGSSTSASGTISGVCVQTIQDWAAADGSGRQVASRPAATCYGYEPSYIFRKNPGPDNYIYPGARSLPTDPASLERFIESHFQNGAVDAGATFEFAGTFLDAGAPPPVRAALYRLIALLPGVKVLGPMTDRLGRPGIGLGFTEYGVRDVLIVDPATSAVLEREGVVVGRNPFGTENEPWWKIGTVINYTIYVTSGVTNSDRVPPG
jgi:hypothetical protein